MSHNSAPGCYIQRIHTAVPQRFLTQEQTEQLLAETCINQRSVKLLNRIVRLTGIRKRHLAALDFQSSLDDEHGIYRASQRQPCGPGMGARTAMFDEACGPLIRNLLSPFSPRSLADVDMLVTVSCTHASSPGLEQPVFAHSSVPHCVDRWNLGFMGCSAALAAIRLVHRATNFDKEALIVTCELSSLHFQYTDQIDQMAANLLFADGAAAVVMSPRRSAVSIVDCRCVTLPENADQMLWFAGDHGLQLRLSQELPETLAQALPDIVAGFLDRNDVPIKAVDHWLVHPGGPQILDSVARSLGLPPNALDHSRAILRDYGNMSSTTILFIMKALFDEKADGTALAISFGPGLTIELVLLQCDHSKM